MFSSNKTRTNQNAENGEASRPLLGDDEREGVVFSIDDDSDEEPLASTASRQSVRFQEDVQVIPPSLRSTTASREAGVCVHIHSSTSRF